MKILVISHTAVMQMMCHAWARAGHEIVELPLPTVAMAQDAGLKRHMARVLFQQLRRERPDLVVDAGGPAAVLPLDAGRSEWTVDAVSVPWCVWWWDAPHVALTSPYYRAFHVPDWLDALRRPHVRHFIWDHTLGREYSAWFGRPFHWLPTAVDPLVLNADAARHSGRSFAPADVCFLGEFYSAPVADAVPDAEAWARRRVREPDRTMFELAETPELKGGAFGKLLARAVAGPAGVFNAEYLAGRQLIDDWTGVKRRNRVLMELSRTFSACRFGGRGWPPELRAEREPVARITEVAACYRSALFNVELGNKQSFSGSAMRSYEIMAVGGVLACRGWPDFDPDGTWEGRAYVSFSSAAELAEARDRLRAEPARLRALRETASRYVAVRHAWPRRLERLLSVLAAERDGSCAPEREQLSCAESSAPSV